MSSQSEEENPDKDPLAIDDSKNESDSDALVIDMDDGEESKKGTPSKKDETSFSEETPTKEANVSLDDSQKRQRKPNTSRLSTSDTEEKSKPPAKKQALNNIKDKRIPKKKSSPPPSITTSRPVSPSTETKPNVSPTKTVKFEQVEDALEAMFADLASDPEAKPEIVPKEEPVEKKTSTDKIDEKSEKKQKAVKKENIPQASTKSTSSTKSKPPTSSTQSTNTKAAKKKVLTKKPKVDDRPHINGSNKTINRKSLQERSKDKPDLKQKVIAAGFGYGSHSTTTLSSKYDAKTPDESWKCVFCKRSSHFQGLGDLFGPYFASKEVMSNVNQRSPSKKQDLASKFIIGGADKKKRKRILSSPDHSTPAAASEQLHHSSPLHPLQQNSQGSGVEVWFHEDCVCWMPTVKFVGHNLLGLDEAIRQSHVEMCSKCHLTGSTLGCVHRGCRETAHYLCARSSFWMIDEETFKALCPQHL